MRLLAVAAAAVGLAVPTASVDYVASRQQPDGGYAEIGGRSSLGLTAFAVLGLTASGRQVEQADEVAAFLEAQPAPAATDLELKTMALAALGRPVGDLVGRIEALKQPDGRIGPLVNSTAWGVLALRSGGSPVDASTVEWLVGRQGRAGGWGWSVGGSPDTDDTAVAIEALRAAGVPASTRTIRRGLAYLRRARRPDGGYGQAPGSPSNVQTTAWVVQALVAAGRDASRALAYIRKMQRPDGSFRYSARYATTPLWVTSEALPALARRPFPLTP